VVDAEMPVAIPFGAHRQHVGILGVRVGPVIPPVPALVRNCPALADEMLGVLEAALIDLNGHFDLAQRQASAARTVSYACWPCATA
jgi:hypothetical protein